MSAIHAEEMEMEADSFARREVWTKASMCKEDPVHLGNSSCSRLEEMVCREEELRMEKENQHFF